MNNRTGTNLLVSLAVAILLTLSPQVSQATHDLDIYSTDLIAGQNLDVGEVQVWRFHSNLFVKYQTTDGWLLATTHLSIQTSADAFPLNSKGNPKIGLFEYQTYHDPLVTSFEYMISLDDLPADTGTELFIAAHADVRMLEGYQEVDLEAVSASLPEGLVTQVVAYPGGDSYFNTTVSGAGALDGTYDGWCVDTSRSISPGNTYQSEVISSYEAAAAGVVDRPENLDSVNYIVNQADEYIALGYNFASIQTAIWRLVDDNPINWSGYNPAHVQAIVDDALSNGEGYLPPCDGSVAVILNPLDSSGNTSSQITIAQVTLIGLGLECVPDYSEETAWGLGQQFNPSASWAMFFSLVVPEMPHLD